MPFATIKKTKLNPHQLTAIGFAIIILIGGLLLALPISSTSGASIGILDALFTSTSAVCVTGLVVLDTGQDFTLFGQLIIMLLIQIGGMGFMTYGVIIALILGKRIGLKQRVFLQESTKSSSIQGLVKLVLSIFFITLTFEAVGALILWLRWIPDLGLGQAAYYAVFHSVSSFNNAGFGLWSDSLVRYVGDPIVNIVISMLYIAGGIGFMVIVDIYRKRRWSKFALHTKIVLLISTLLSVGGFIIIFILELFNPAVFGHLTLSEQLWAAYFQSTTTRTAGFNSIDLAGMLTASQFLMVFLMFIGASSGSTGGGIKTNTFMVLLVAMYSNIRGRSQVHIFKRKISNELVLSALSVIMISLSLVLVVSFILTITEPGQQFIDLLFEATSAFATVGMSLGITPELSPVGKAIIIFTMFAGRLGPLTLAFALANKQRDSKIGYPEEKVLIG
ncbi:Ktr system potassium transporter B [Paenibacillus sp. GSMTC-2017]|uniref:TrkH family potassium uptake protein n=1 Tax=Paenibacillus sp. GSMTC-2017 TaxID=2794350 RepID=UPI0018D9649D|nr:TrkH family potassium uptake protein [Paenibacillus sp. GSMTC-2017]MBH5318278.1 Ktr system potassium transporter B [Paenibacillus sp. GSMTC-2017]